MSKYEFFDRKAIRLLPLGRRVSLVTKDDLVQPSYESQRVPDSKASGRLPELSGLARALLRAVVMDVPRIFFIGGHVIKSGMGPYLVRLMQDGWITGIASNGAAMIHDYELAVHGGTSESVVKYLPDGKFGFWRELNRLNHLASVARKANKGWGEVVGEDLSKRSLVGGGVLESAWSLGVPYTCHTMVGGDIFHPYASTNGYDLGQASYNDFLIFANQVAHLHGGGVFVCIGSAVHGPEVFLKALSAARNVASSQGGEITDFTTGVFDRYPLPSDWRSREYTPADQEYYYRPLKTILQRSVTDSRRSFYVRGDHINAIPELWHLLNGWS